MSIVAGAVGVGTVMAISKIVDFFGYKKSSQYKAQVERDERLHELQCLQQRENQVFQITRDLQNQEFQFGQQTRNQNFQHFENEQNRAHQNRLQRENQLFQIARDAQQIAFQKQRDAEQRHFQMEMEANRMAYQERIEMRRLQVQKQLEDQRNQLTVILNKKNLANNREIAKFSAMAMRETQILVARENAQNMLQDHMVQDALKNFPLNISPLVLLRNRPHSLSSLLRFTVGEKCNIEDVVDDVNNYAFNPEALNVFVAPIYVDSKIKNREILSRQIWDTIYQRLESFFTVYYNRRSERPVIFYPTAWNDKHSPGMHASETLHFFLRDMPCLVLEPRFDGNNFRVMISSWGLGYTSNEHIRTEINFDINIDTYLAHAVYERSKNALNVLKDLINTDITENEKTPFITQQRILERNIKLYESLRIEERINNKKMNEVEALGIYNIFKIEPMQDLSSLSQSLSSQIGMALATLTDIHHLCSTDSSPIYPKLMKDKFPELYSNVELRNNLYKIYEQAFLNLLSDEKRYLSSFDEKKLLTKIREEQMNAIKLNLGLQEEIEEDIENKIREISKIRFKYENPDFTLVWDTCLNMIKEGDKVYFRPLLVQIKNEKMKKQLEKVLERELK